MENGGELMYIKNMGRVGWEGPPWWSVAQRNLEGYTVHGVTRVRHDWTATRLEGR